MGALSFEWDERTAEENLAKHSVSFQEASTVFYDPQAIVIDDPDHSAQEDRFIILGISRTLRLLVVCHCYRRTPEHIRIISARKATKHESSSYSHRYA